MAVRAPQIPRWPSPITNFGARSPRRFKSRSRAAQLYVDSRYPLSTARITFRPSRRPAEDDEHRRLVLLEAGLHIDAVDPEVDDLKVRDGAGPPALVLGLPPGLQPRDRGGRQRRAVPQQPAQRQIEVAEGQAMQVQLRQEPPDLLSVSLERRQQPTLEALGQPAHPRPAHGERPAA